MGGGGGSGGMSYQNRSPMQPQMQQQSMNFGSTPHLGQQQQQQQQLYQSNNFGGGGGPGFALRSAPTNREYPPNQYVDEQGRYVQQQQQQGMSVQQAYGNSRENSPYQVHRTNSYNPMMGNNGNNGNNNNNNGGYADSYGMGGDTGYQSSGPLPIQLHKNFLSRENLNQSVYFNNSNSSNNDPSYSAQSVQLSQAQPPPSNQFYLHDQNAGNGSPPVAPQRRTWAQSAAQKQGSVENSWSSPLNNSGKAGGGFMLHQNGGDSDSFLNNSGNLFPVHTSSPQHNRVHRQISQMIDESTRVAEQQLAANRVSYE